jgi:hypothetical protein
MTPQKLEIEKMEGEITAELRAVFKSNSELSPKVKTILADPRSHLND